MFFFLFPFVLSLAEHFSFASLFSSSPSSSLRFSLCCFLFRPLFFLREMAAPEQLTLETVSGLQKRENGVLLLVEKRFLFSSRRPCRCRRRRRRGKGGARFFLLGPTGQGHARHVDLRLRLHVCRLRPDEPESVFQAQALGHGPLLPLPRPRGAARRRGRRKRTAP